MQKFGFKIQTRSGLTVDNLTIQATDQAEAERRLRQMYMHCTILEATALVDSPPRSEMSDLEGVITLIAGHDKNPTG
jgi:hypothetical protein